MILSDTEIKKLIYKGELIIAPILRKKVQIHGAKIDLRLDNIFKRIKSEKKTYQDISTSDLDVEKITVPYSGKFILHPNDFVLGQTFELINLPENIMGRLGGRSSMARKGVIVHATADIVDPGFQGVLTLELSNIGKIPVLLRPLHRVACISFEEIKGKVTKTYMQQEKPKFGGGETPSNWSPDEETEEFTRLLRKEKI